MSMPRYALSFVLTLALAGAPVAQALAMAASSMPDSAGMHVGHGAQQHNAASTIGNESHGSACAQHDLCDGSCCANCAQCFTSTPPPLFYTEVFRPALTPSVYRLAFRTLAAPRERPPRFPLL